MVVETDRRGIAIPRRVISTFAPIGAKVEKTRFESQLDDVRFQTGMFALGFSKPTQNAGMKPTVVELRSQGVLFRLSPRSGRVEKTRLGSQLDDVRQTGFLLCLEKPTQKAGLTERRPIAFKTRFFDFPHRGETK